MKLLNLQMGKLRSNKGKNFPPGRCIEKQYLTSAGSTNAWVELFVKCCNQPSWIPFQTFLHWRPHNSYNIKYSLTFAHRVFYEERKVNIACNNNRYKKG